MKRFMIYMISLCLLLFMLSGCTTEQPQIVATTLPVYTFTSAICENTGLQVGQLVAENVSCLHDYTLKVSQMRMAEAAEVIVISGAGLEDFLEDVLISADNLIDSSVGCHLHEEGQHSHDHEHTHAHAHAGDPHIWLSPENAKSMAANICSGLTEVYPEYADIFAANLNKLLAQLDALQAYGEETLQALSCRKLITFHDGFAYFAESFDLEIIEAIEEESGSEASAQELTHLITLVNEHRLPAVFTEENGSVSAAEVICRETGIDAYCLSMAMSDGNYFDSMYRNINTIKEALE